MLPIGISLVGGMAFSVRQDLLRPSLGKFRFGDLLQKKLQVGSAEQAIAIRRIPTDGDFPFRCPLAKRGLRNAQNLCGFRSHCIVAEPFHLALAFPVK